MLRISLINQIPLSIPRVGFLSFMPFLLLFMPKLLTDSPIYNIIKEKGNYAFGGASMAKASKLKSPIPKDKKGNPAERLASLRKKLTSFLTMKRKIMILSLPALVGFCVFYVYPFLRAIAYSFIDNLFSKQFVGISNYVSVLSNEFFRMALKNTAVFSAISVFFTMLIALILSIGLVKLSSRFAFLKSFFIMPYILPTASIVFIWQSIFGVEQYEALTQLDGLSSFFEILPLYLLFTWKNIGIDVILITSALMKVTPEVYEAAAVDGASGFRLHFNITLPLISPSLFFVVVLTFLNSLKIFKESYLYYNTNYPPDVAYMIQNYMNNHFYKLNYQNLSCAVVILTAVMSLLVYLIYRVEAKTGDYTN